MLVKVTLLCKGSLALGADVILSIDSVYQHVRAEVRLVRKCLVTSGMLAVVWPLPSVRSHVALEQPRTRELLMTDGALVLVAEVSRQHMAAECRQNSEHFAAGAAPMQFIAARVGSKFVEIQLNLVQV